MEPLAHRMKPQTLKDFFGQQDIIAKDKLLYRLIKADKLTSVIFWGPPGSRENFACSHNSKYNKT